LFVIDLPIMERRKAEWTLVVYLSADSGLVFITSA